MSDKPELWDVHLSVQLGSLPAGNRFVRIRIEPPFGIKQADAEVKAIKWAQDLNPHATVRCVSSHFIGDAP